MENELVRYSRAGDVFHYRWAARRCLKLIHPKSSLKQVVIEGSKETSKAGEYVIDVAEYYDIPDNKTEEIVYYQLKHTTVRKNILFNLSDLKDAFTGFSRRYSAHLKENNSTSQSPKITFTIVTNRPININLKENISKIANSEKANKIYWNTLKKYTKLRDDELRGFCACLRFADGEGDYSAQKYELHMEISQLLAGTIDSPIIENITSLVRDKALPNSKGGIVREEILRYFGVSSERDLFPAPVEFEKLQDIIHRWQHKSLQVDILSSNNPIIIHAPGGVGKTVFARQIVQSLTGSSLGVVYDCFGGGRYRNRSELRHRHRDGLVQIANELALENLCDPLLIQSNATEDDILRKFLDRIKSAVSSLKKINSDANLVILIDAADNAEMAAIEFGHNCFVHELLREEPIDGVKIVALCRTERIHLLQPSSSVKQIELELFNEEETFKFLESKYPQVSKSDGVEFHRLTNGNPRVQANAMDIGANTINELFNNLIAIGTNVDEQIKAQLSSAVAKIRDKLTIDYQKQIEAICIGLATLPPFVPLKILSRVADVEESTIKSFVAEMGRPLWLIDNSVQFRDEPTETWFRETYAATEEQIGYYVERLKPLAIEYSYVASTIPSLLLQARRYSELVEMAISDNFLPNNNPVDKRNVRIYRLQFAFKAALNQGDYANAIKLALRAGEEVAGDKRQYELLTKNIDLIAPLLDEGRVQEFAFRRSFGGAWRGSENLYSASLLSTVEQFKGEARSYLRAAHSWLNIYFEEQKNLKEADERQLHHEKLEYDDIVEFVFTHLNLHGVDKAVKFLLSWSPSSVIYHVSRKIFKRLIDVGNFEIANKIAFGGLRSQQLIIAFAHELLEVGQIPSDKLLETSLDLLASKRARFPKPRNSFGDTTLLSLICFLESCAARGLSKRKILRVLKHFYPERARNSFTSNFQNNDREIYLRAIALKNALLNNAEIAFNELAPEDLVKENKYRSDQDTREFKEIIGGLIPWYQIRIGSLIGNIKDILNEAEGADKRSKSARASRWKDYDIIPSEISKICSDIFLFYSFGVEDKAKRFYEIYVQKDNRLTIQNRIRLVRSAFRLDLSFDIKRDLEEYAYEAIRTVIDENPETKANWYIDLARSVVNVNSDDAAIYFNLAIEAVSKFGDELVERWEAIVSIANRRKVEEQTSYHIAYRFIRCAELVGENVVREKYWDRNEAIRTSVRLSPVTTLAALSRWRDRRIGQFERQLFAFIQEAVSNKYISPTVAWSLSAFLSEDQLVEFSVVCIEKEQSKEKKQHLLDSAVNELRLNGFEGPSWKRIKEVASKYSLRNVSLDENTFYLIDNKKTTEVPKNQVLDTTSRLEKEGAVNWNQLLDGLDLKSPEGLTKALTLFDSIQGPVRNHQSFWREIYNRILDSDAVKFLYVLVNTEKADLYDLRYALSQIPDNWCRKVSVKNEWPNIMEILGKRFASTFVERGTIHYFTHEIRMKMETIAYIHNGIIKGLGAQVDMVSATTFFGFVIIASKHISTIEANQLLDYALSRFEIHIETDFADGPSMLQPPDSINKAFAGFVWSALGSPKRLIRWRAVHCVLRLANAQCINVIDELIYWMEKDMVDVFGASKFPFYNLHARLYLLIALARISISNPVILLHHSNVFCKYSLETSPHILIQRYASNIALNLEKAYPGTYTKEIVEMLRKVGISQFVRVKTESNWKTIDSYWHENGKIDSNLNFYHGYDFDSYWFEPLGEVFGISGEQVKDLANDVLINEWNINQSDGYLNDPRRGIWKSSTGEPETYHSHGSYPQVDDYKFYLSLHAMFAVAAKLLEKMPIVSRTDWYEDEWEGWLHRHLLTRDDGLWLYDRRDPVPLPRRYWIDEEKDPNWRFDINSKDFIDGMFVNRDGEPWLNVFGFWTDGDGDRSESFSISSALVSIDSSQALLNALSTCSNPHDFKIPNYGEGEMEFNEFPFILKGWVYREEISDGIDKFDPHAAKINYPPYIIGKSIAEKMMLSNDYESSKWTLPGKEKASVTCEIWGNVYDNNDEDSIYYGNRLTASLSILKQLCVEFQSELIIEVQISRNFRPKSYMRSEDKDGYKPPISKIFVLSADGQLRDTETYYEFRQNSSGRT
ncbi:ATP-binding protein [Priestia megaterium]|uniref:ATP-binding protein n=1 Tax=Priestia megaterium TaxID=1404 RepID=UPI001AE07AE5|nr:ATP-binding protein [Priestia megaterium]